MSQSACLLELQKLSEKLHRAYQRRDHYAQLYYRVLAELEDTKWELNLAKKKIHEIKSQGIHFMNEDSVMLLEWKCIPL